MRNFPAATVTRKGEAAIKNGHPWVYAAEITEKRGSFENGCLADVFSAKGSYLGTGLYSEKSKIAVRLLADNANERFDDAFFARRIRYALAYRRAVMGSDFSCCRLVFGEADGLPGLTVDRFSDILVAQVLSYGMDKRKALIFRELYGQLTAAGEKIAGLYERNDSPLRALEGLGQDKGWFEELPHPEETATEIVENGIRYLVDFENGQRPAFFSTRNTTGWRSPASRASHGAGLLYPHRRFRPERRTGRRAQRVTAGTSRVRPGTGKEERREERPLRPNRLPGRRRL
jgi:23S rRNA (cytosine1962-C5)-methyltransferase